MSGFANSVVGGAETLIRSAIKSINYVLGVAGWRITKAGSAEFNDLTARGSITAGNGIVFLNNGGVAVEDATHEFEINISAGFLARTKPADGSQINFNSHAIFLTPIEPSPGGGSNDPGVIASGIDGSPPSERLYTAFNSPNFLTLGESTVVAYSQALNDAGADNTSEVLIFAADAGFVLSDATSKEYHRGETGNFLLTFGGLTQTTVAVTFAKDYNGQVPRVFCNIDSGAGPTARWVPRAINLTATGFTFFVFAADIVAANWTNIPLSWVAILD